MRREVVAMALFTTRTPLGRSDDERTGLPVLAVIGLVAIAAVCYPPTMGVGIAIALLIAALTVWWAIRAHSR
jgi:hypothetical protein